MFYVANLVGELTNTAPVSFPKSQHNYYSSTIYQHFLMKESI